MLNASCPVCLCAPSVSFVIPSNFILENSRPSNEKDMDLFIYLFFLFFTSNAAKQNECNTVCTVRQALNQSYFVSVVPQILQMRRILYINSYVINVQPETNTHSH